MRYLCVTSVKNEAPFLLEWIAHHQGLGITDFLIFSNDCDDGTEALLNALDRAGVVTHLPQMVEEGTSPQWQALRAAWKHPLRKACDWALVCDVDEFIAIHTGEGHLNDLITALPPEADGILLPWRLFGSNGQVAFQDCPVTETFTKAMPENCIYPVAATFFKSLFRLTGPFNQFGVHRPKQKAPGKSRLPVWVNGAGQILPDAFARNPQRLSLYGFPNGRSLAECHHYSLKSAESFLVKRARGLPNRSEKSIDLAYWVERNFNHVEVPALAQRAGELRPRIDALRALPGVGALHEAGVAWHRAKFLELIRSEAEHQLLSQILVCGDSQSPAPRVTRQLVAWYQEIHRQKLTET